MRQIGRIDGLRLAFAIGVGVAATSIGIRLTELPGVVDPAPGRFVAPLVVVALVCAAGLATRVEPVALLLLAAACGAAAIDGIALGHAVDTADPGRHAWPMVAGVVSLQATATVGISAVYVWRRTTRPLPRGASALAVAWFGLSCAIVVIAVLAGAEEDPAVTWLDIATLPQRAWPQLVLGILALAVGFDLVPATVRARRALARSDAAAGLEPRRPAPTRLLGAVLDEIDPGRRRAAQEAALAERRRLASDLHAGVLPALRSAVAEAEEHGSPELLGRRLREVLVEIESTIVDRRFVVLEELGLVPALEWLAEREEERSGVVVDLSIDGSTDGRRPPATVEEAAFRISRLALDNAVRHGAATRIVVAIAAGASTTRLSLVDDGSGYEEGAAADARRNGRLGIADMHAIAHAVDGTLEVSGLAPRGTRVTFSWPRQ